MAITQGYQGLEQDESNQIQDPSLPSPLGLDFNNPKVQEALANMNISGFDQQPEEQAIAIPQSPSTIDKLTAALAASKPTTLDRGPTSATPEAPPIRQLDFTGTNDQNYAEDLRQAQAQKNNELLSNRLGEAGVLIGAGIAHSNPAQGQKLFQDANKYADQPIKDLEARKEAEAKDPNSNYSKGLREWAKASYGIDLKGASAEQVEKIAPYLSKQYEAQQERQNKRSLLEDKNKERQFEAEQRSKDRGVKLAELKQRAKEQKDAKDTARFDTDFRRLGEKLTEETASSRSVLGKAANISRSADAINALASQIPDPNNLDTRQIQEIARNLDAMLSSGASTISGTEKLVPHTASGDSAKIAEYIAGIPKGANQAEFVKRMVDTVNREKSLAQKQIGVAKTKITSGYGHLEKADPERYHGILKAHSIDNTDDSYSDAQEKGIQRVMNDNKVPREQAIKALKDAGKL